jgi:flagellar P-ring protein precursor FlgI
MVRKHNFKILPLLIAPLLIGLGAISTQNANAERVGRLVSVAGAPSNQLVGYGLVVGLPGTGDQTTQIPYTQQAITNMLAHEGITLPATAFMQPNDVASVMVTANVPPYSSPGSHITATIAALGNATSLAGGILLPTPLKGANGQVYAQVQGAILVSGFAAGAGGSTVRTNTPTVGRIPHGAIMSRSIPTDSWSQAGTASLILKRPSFENATRIADAINRTIGAGTAQALSPGDIKLNGFGTSQPVVFMANVLDVKVTPKSPPPTVVVDAQSGTIVMGGNVRLRPAIVSHGNLTVDITATSGVSQPGALSNGTTVGVTNTNVQAKQSKGHVVNLPASTTLAQIAAALNKIGATPSDLIAIVEALKEAGSLRADVRVV